MDRQTKDELLRAAYRVVELGLRRTYKGSGTRDPLGVFLRVLGVEKWRPYMTVAQAIDRIGHADSDEERKVLVAAWTISSIQREDGDPDPLALVMAQAGMRGLGWDNDQGKLVKDPSGGGFERRRMPLHHAMYVLHDVAREDQQAA
jgi:hypothetical protein